MTIEEKAKAYDEAIKIAKETYNTQPMYRNWLESMFPELQENEIKDMREKLIKAFGSIGKKEWGGVNVKDVIHWLEKQGESYTKKDVDDAYLKGICDAKHELEKQGEQKVSVADFKANDWYVSKVDGKIRNIYYSVDKVEPKFKVGDWITNGRYNRLIVGINSDWPFYMFKDGTSKRIKDIENKYHLWTIQDAKDGDVLVDKYGNIGIYQGDKNAVRWNSYCYCGVNKVFYDEGSHEFPCYPATKEQQDTLEKAMADAGYTFDFEKKELKKPQRMISAEAKEALYDKVEPKFNIGDVLCDKSCTTLDKNSQPNIEILDIRAGMYICNNCSFPISQQDEYELVAKRIVPQSAAWSDEDENYLQSAENACEYQYGKNTSTILWLKSLKDRVQPKQEWSEEDENYLNTTIAYLKDANEFKKTAEKCIAWLKSLRPQNNWKPSDEQMKQLGWIAEQNKDNMIGKELISLHQDLKKLREG